MASEERKKELLQKLSDGVVNFDESLVQEAAQATLDEGFDAFEAIMDGLAAGYIVVTASMLGIVAYQLVMPEYLYIVLALVGACVGFLPFNFRWRKSALIFLVDSGATFLGFVMGALTLEGKWGSRNDVYHSINEVGVVIPLLVLGVAIFDTTFTIVKRIADRRVTRFSPMR